MKLWRVAGKDGKGFYYTDVGGVTMNIAVGNYLNRDISSFCEQHPRPGDDGIRDVESHHFFAFSSLDQLYRWFDAEIFAASCKHGAMMEVWEVDSRYVKFGRKQVCFEKDKAVKLEVAKLDKYKIRR